MGKNIFSGQVKQFVNHQVVVTEELMKRPVDVQMCYFYSPRFKV